jgi:beta-lactamase superfamily II metal-dependent hydrolase
MRILAAFLFWAAAAWPAKTLDVYFIDVEGGQATLVVSPSGRSMLVDTGWPGFEERDATRIAAAARQAGVKQIDFLVITHFHRDHVGGITQLAAKLPIRNFVDHGPNIETGKGAEELSAAYDKVKATGKHLLVKPGDTIPIPGIGVQVLTANGDIIQKALPGGGQANSLCASTQRREDDKTENSRSVGVLISYDKFRMIDLGDLTWNKELDLVCPENRIGTVDVYLSTHHGMNVSGAPAIVHALRPRVAIQNNGARKGGTAEAWQVMRSSPGLEDLWQLHFAVAGGKENNSPDTFIANTDERCEGQWLKLSAEPTGAFTVTNSRNKYQKAYKPRS